MAKYDYKESLSILMFCENYPTVSLTSRKWTQEANMEFLPSSRSGGP
jgi:hypothetical protein